MIYALKGLPEDVQMNDLPFIVARDSAGSKEKEVVARFYSQSEAEDWVRKEEFEYKEMFSGADGSRSLGMVIFFAGRNY